MQKGAEWDNRLHPAPKSVSHAVAMPVNTS